MVFFGFRFKIRDIKIIFSHSNKLFEIFCQENILFLNQIYIKILTALNFLSQFLYSKDNFKKAINKLIRWLNFLNKKISETLEKRLKNNDIHLI